MMYVLSRRTVSALPRVLLWYLYNPLMSAETIRYSSTYTILYILRWTKTRKLVNLWQYTRVPKSIMSRIEKIT